MPQNRRPNRIAVHVYLGHPPIVPFIVGLFFCGAAETTFEEISLGEIPKGLLMKTIHWQTKEGDTRGYSVNVILLEGYKLKDFD